MKNSYFGEIIISLILIVLLVFLINPMNFWMPQPANMMMVAALAVLFVIFAGFVWKEKASDERESLHRYIGARFAYLTGTGVLVLGVVFESLSHMIDGWLVIALGAMILAKVVGLLYGRIKH